MFKKVALALALISGIAQLAEGSDMIIYASGGTSWQSTDYQIEIYACKLGVKRTIYVPNKESSDPLWGWQPRVVAFGENDFNRNVIKKAGISLEWFQGPQVILGKYITAFGWQTPSPAEEPVMGTPVYSLLEVYGTGVHFIGGPIYLGYYGKDIGGTNLWEAVFSKNLWLFQFSRGLGRMPEYQLLGKVDVRATNWLSSAITAISADSNGWGNPDDIAAHWRTILTTNKVELYQQVEWDHQHYAGITAGGNLVLALNTRLMVAYTTTGVDRWEIRVSWYLKKNL